MTKSIALIFHEHEQNRSLPSFAIWHLAEIWRREGIKVNFLLGVKKYVPADMAILHVDLTMVPQEYTDFAHRYPVALNGNLRNIKKSLISRNKVGPDDGYEGRVIVKSELNYAGQPERKLLGTPLSRLTFRIACRLPFYRSKITGPGPHFKSPSDYIIQDSSHSVPRGWFNRDDILVEKFIPEMQDGLYCLRIYHFLGNRGVCILWKSGHPIVKSSTVTKREVVEVHPEIVKLTKSIGFDYGKFDYVMHEGKPVLLDANKTPGSANTAAFMAICPEWAKGIRAYL
jgi:hypothetical protein